jgi:hypothetical protein
MCPRVGHAAVWHLHSDGARARCGSRPRADRGRRPAGVAAWWARSVATSRRGRWSRGSGCTGRTGTRRRMRPPRPAARMQRARTRGDRAARPLLPDACGSWRIVSSVVDADGTPARATIRRDGMKEPCASARRRRRGSREADGALAQPCLPTRRALPRRAALGAPGSERQCRAAPSRTDELWRSRTTRVTGCSAKGPRP